MKTKKPNNEAKNHFIRGGWTDWIISAMNQYIQIRYKSSWHYDPNYWDIWFGLNKGGHREKSPSLVYSNGWWSWRIQDKFQKTGYEFDWNKE